MARNHTDKGVRVSWKIVPAVTEVWYPHPAHSLRLRTSHAFPDPQWAQRKPVGQRSRAKYARHASSVLKFASNSVRSAVGELEALLRKRERNPTHAEFGSIGRDGSDRYTGAGGAERGL